MLKRVKVFNFANNFSTQCLKYWVKLINCLWVYINVGQMGFVCSTVFNCKFCQKRDWFKFYLSFIWFIMTQSLEKMFIIRISSQPYKKSGCDLHLFTSELELLDFLHYFQVGFRNLPSTSTLNLAAPLGPALDPDPIFVFPDFWVLMNLFHIK